MNVGTLARDECSRRSRVHRWGPLGGPGQPHPATPPLAAFLVGLGLSLLPCGCAGRAALQPRAAEELVRGWAYLEKGDAERAEVAFEHALEFHPDLPEAHNGLGVVARTRGELPAARARFERAVRLSPDFAEGHANLGETLLALGRARAAEAELRAALRVDPDLAEARQNLARALVARGVAAPAEREEAWRRARRELLHLLESEPLRPAAHHDLAFLDYSQGRFERAEAGYRRAVELAPGSHEALHGLCISLVRLGRCGEAARACERCLEVRPGAAACLKSLRGARACE
jgi:Tfp pilus assembly protein PilF